jgi:hypothetical protein
MHVCAFARPSWTILIYTRVRVCMYVWLRWTSLRSWTSTHFALRAGSCSSNFYFSIFLCLLVFISKIHCCHYALLHSVNYAIIMIGSPNGCAPLVMSSKLSYYVWYSISYRFFRSTSLKRSMMWKNYKLMLIILIFILVSDCFPIKLSFVSLFVHLNVRIFKLFNCFVLIVKFSDFLDFCSSDSNYTHVF